VWEQLSSVLEEAWDEQQEFGLKDFELKPCTIAALRGRRCRSVDIDSEDDPYACFVPVCDGGSPKLMPLWALRQDCSGFGSEGEGESGTDGDDGGWVTGDSGSGAEEEEEEGWE
jgi:hypothetical protein